MDYMDNLRQCVRKTTFVLHWGRKTDFQPVQEPKKGRIAMVQQVRKSIIALAFLLPGPLLGQAPSAPLTIKPDAPERYTVVPRGHALGDLATLYRLPLALAGALESQPRADSQPAPDLPRLRDRARPRARPA